MSDDYIARTLIINGTLVAEADFDLAGVIVVLAEPGAGKSDLLDSFARRLGVRRQRASVFRNSSRASASAVVIDALDEVARQDWLAVDEIIDKALSLGASTVVLASRSSEWGEERNRLIAELVTKPTVARLVPLDDGEQRALFKGWFAKENFDSFRAEAARFGLVPLLGNPMFLKLMAEGLAQVGHRFSSKQQIFEAAVDRLANDSKYGRAAGRPPVDRVVAGGSAMFAGLMLSGATGVSTVQRLDDRDFPYFMTFVDDGSLASAVIDSQLLKPAGDADLHEPVHRIVAEHCAGRYLAKRLSDGADRLSIRRCLALIAPNGVVRAELRGLLGWLAAYGDVALQLEVIDLDAYAVLANGDPALLATQCKRRLLARMRELARVDPLFRRSDDWRTFNVAGFFTAEVVEDVRQLLISTGVDFPRKSGGLF